MGKQRTTRLHHRKGAIVILAACSLVMVMAFLAFSIDLGYVVVTQSELQNASDSAALSGARALLKGRDAAVSAAQEWASKQTAAGQAVNTIVTEDIQLGLWDDRTASFTVLPADSGESPNAVRVTCRRVAARGNELKLFFASVIGSRYADLTATATAAIQRDRCGVIVGLDYVDVRNGKIDSFDSKLGTYADQTPTQNGDVCSDGPISLGPQGFIYGDAAPGQGYTVNAPSQVSGHTMPRLSKIYWKPVDATSVSTNNLNSTIPKRLLTNGRLRLTGDTLLTLEPGNYYFPNGIDMSGTSSIAVTGPTRIVMGGTSSLSGTGIVNNTQLASNLRIDIVNGSASFSGNLAMYADIYAPTADLNVDGSAGFYGAMFGKSVLLSGSASSIHGDEALRREYDETTRSTLKQ